MSSYVQYASRPGHTGLSLVTLAGLSAFSAALWHVAPGYVILLFAPSILLCAYQMVVTPLYGLRMTSDTWLVMDGVEDVSIPTHMIAYLRVLDAHGSADVSLVLLDGREIDVPFGADLKPAEVIEVADSMGVAVRTH